MAIVAATSATPKRKGKKTKPPPAATTDNAAGQSQTTQSSATVTGSRSPSSTATANASTNEILPSPPSSAASNNETTTDVRNNAPTEPTSARQRLTAAASKPKTRKRKLAQLADEGDDKDEAAIQRSLDRAIRWNSFLFFTNDLWEDILKSVYGSGVDIDSVQAQQARAKIFDNVKGYKNKVLKHMVIHVRELLAAPEYQRLTMYTTRQLLSSFFKELFSTSNFFYVWYYMSGYVEYEGSSALGQYYMRSIYTNLATEVKLYLDVEGTGAGVLDARNQLLCFYDTIPLHENFEVVDKDDFKELTHRYRNDKTSPKKKCTEMLETHFVSLGAPPAKAPIVTPPAKAPIVTPPAKAPPAKAPIVVNKTGNEKDGQPGEYETEDETENETEGESSGAQST